MVTTTIRNDEELSPLSDTKKVFKEVPQEQVVDNTNGHFTHYISKLRQKYRHNKKVLLIQTPQFQFETFNVEVARNKGMYAYPPTGLQCLAAVISSVGLEVAILDLNYLLLKKIIEENLDVKEWLSVLDDYLEKYDPSVIGLTSLTSYNDVLRPFHPLTSILRHLRQNDRAMIMIGGATANNEYEEYLKRDLAQVALLKEGELKVSWLLEHFFASESGTAGKISFAVAGLAFPYQGSIKITAGENLHSSMEKNIIETYNLIPIEDYHTVGSLSPYSRMAGMEKPFSVFQLNRGCRANCKFCDVSKFMGRGVRTHPVKEVVKELTYLVEERGIQHFEVLDDDFLGNLPAVKELLLEMIILHKKYGMTWSANNGLIAGSLTEEICALLRDSGCIGFRIGIESGNPDMIRKLRKPATLQLLLQRGELLQKFPEMFTGANYILGLFGEETFAQMMDTFHFSNKLNLDWSSFSTFQFTSRETAQIENLRTSGRVAGEFTPSKDNARGEIPETEGIFSGVDIFKIKPEDIPSPLQVKQIWFTFNLIGNYINNKNIRPGGYPAKFVAWVEAVSVVYPYNPYMPLFAALGQVLLGKNQEALENFAKAHKNVAISDYWKHRFQQFQLQELMDNFPSTAEEVYTAIEKVREPFQRWI